MLLSAFQVDELHGNLEEKDQALTKAREALHKAQLQKYQVSRMWRITSATARFIPLFVFQ